MSSLQAAQAVRTVHIHKNGDKFQDPKKFVVNQRQYPDMDTFLDEVTKKMGPTSRGPLRRIHTPNTGHQVPLLQDLQPGQHYVAAGNERFEKMKYVKGQKAELTPRHGHQDGKDGPCIINVFRNGDSLTPATLVVFRRGQPPQQVFALLRAKMKFDVKNLYVLNGRRVGDISRLKHGGYYVASGPERFKRVEYRVAEDGITPRKRNGVLPPLKKEVAEPASTKWRSASRKAFIASSMSNPTGAGHKARKPEALSEATDRSVPAARLRLEWVYGYRGHRCRNNVHYSAAGEVVYFAAAVGIVYNPDKHTQRFFMGHNDDIISLALHPERTLVATGQVGDESGKVGSVPFVCVWDSNTTQAVSILKGVHAMGARILDFDATGERLVSVGVGPQPEVVVWDWSKGQVLGKGVALDRVFDVKFNPWKPEQLVTCGVDHLQFWTLSPESGMTSEEGDFTDSSRKTSLLSVAFGSGDVVYSGTEKGDVYVWRDGKLSAQEVVQNAHESKVVFVEAQLTADPRGSARVRGFSSVSSDGTVNLYDENFSQTNTLKLGEGDRDLSVCSLAFSPTARTVLVGTTTNELLEVDISEPEAPRTVHELVQGHGPGELRALAVHPSEPSFLTSGEDHTVRIWSMKDRSPVLRREVHDGTVMAAAFSPDGSHIALGMKDGKIEILYKRDMSQKTVHVTSDTLGQAVCDLNYSPDGRYLAAASHDGRVAVFDPTANYDSVRQFPAGSYPVMHIDWSTDSRFLQTNDEQGERQIYKMPEGKMANKRDDLSAIAWETWTGVLGDEVQGIWPKYSDLSDVNTADVNFDHGVMVTGDDQGLVKLFRFPCIRKGAKFRKYGGHADHVTNVRFSCEGSRVVSIGGADSTVFQWKLLPDIPDVDASVTDYLSSDEEQEDSDVSDADLDSDVEQEAEVTYDRHVAKDDVKKRKKSFKYLTSGVDRNKPPYESLQLKFVHGYRAQDCRNNLHYTRNGEVVYHVAAVGIVYERDSHSQRFYLQHTDDILCLTKHPTDDIFATGQVGKDPAIHVWESENMENLAVLQGQHARGVCELDFTAAGTRLASVGLDDDHSIVIWDWKTATPLAKTKGHKDKIFGVQWNPYDSARFVTIGIKHVKFWTMSGNSFTSRRGIFGSAGEINTMVSVAHGSSPEDVYTGAPSGQVYVWRGNNLARTVQAHSGPCFSVKVDGHDILTAGKDGVVCVWTEDFAKCVKRYTINRHFLRAGQGALLEDKPPVRTVCPGEGAVLVGTKNGEVLELDRATGKFAILAQGHMGRHRENELWGLATHPTKHIVATVSDDRTLRLWDVAENVMLAARRLEVGGRCADFSPDGRLLAVGQNNGSFFVLHLESWEIKTKFHHRKEKISDIRFSPDGKYLAVASHENHVDVYNMEKGKRVGICKGASSYITHIDWEGTGRVLQVNSGARERLFFEVPRCKHLPMREPDKTLQWYTWTGVLGPLSSGVWPAGCDVTDVNAVSASHDWSLLAAADDFGFVKLFRFPCDGDYAKFKKYLGHSSHVTNVRWSHDDTRLMTTGGMDTSLMVWVRRRSAPRDDGACESDDSDTDLEDGEDEEEEDEDDDVVDEVEKSRALFAMADVDSDGTVTSSELAKALRKLGYRPTEADIRDILAAADDEDAEGTNGDSGVDPGESDSLDFDRFHLALTSYRDRWVR
ncbi:echinoderm microtubule-associated protein-like 6 [Branchiostoma lanceolatum]|uniref:echinoderm microtubule-associated protein-like 6 n=1 Tax=Branchiostoma lanceolatum TaxID=7740 RepID=UPI0034523C39